MKRFILDSGIANKILDRHPVVYAKAQAAIRAGNPIGIGTPVLGELYAGLQFSDSKNFNLVKLNRALKTWSIWDFDWKAAEEFGLIRAHLKKIGNPIQRIDIQLAAIARTLPNCTVVTMDSDYSAIPRLNIVNWMTP